MWNVIKIKKKLLREAFLEEKKDGGFSLLETSLVLMITGLMIGGIIPVMQSFYRQAQWKQTKENQERIIEALGFYLSRKGHLPLPADPFADEKEKGQTSSSRKSSGIGIVPFRTLGLSEKFAKDGFNHWMTYAVDTTIAINPVSRTLDRKTFCNAFFKYPSKLKVIEGEGILEEDIAPEQSGVAVVIVSHGPGGWGSFGLRGHIPFPAKKQMSLGKQQNCKEEGVFCARPSASDNGLFNDIVRWETKGHLLHYYAGIKCGDALFLK